MTPAGDRSRRGLAVTGGLLVLLVAMFLASLVVGPSSLAPSRVPGLLLDGWLGKAGHPPPIEHIILFNVRLPRTLLGLLVGGALALSGTMMQSLFQNPLADPGLIGVSTGASLGAVLAIVLGGLLPPALAGAPLIPLAAFAGGLATTALLYRIATRRGRTSVATMLLAGIALGALAGALTGFMIYLSSESQLRDLVFWMLGGLGGATWRQIGLLAPLVLGALALSPFLAHGLDALALGEAPARHLGVPVQRLKQALILIAAAIVGAAVSVSGVIGFIGLIVPHLLRLLVGPMHRALLPAAALLGASLIVAADMLCRTIVAPGELPIGIVTATLGAPFFLLLLLHRRGMVEL